jgi:small subunit ribosomal protein S17
VQVRGTRKSRVGRVTSDAMDKTVVVAVETLEKHPEFGRRIRRTKKMKAHDEQNEARVGDRVRVVETRPLSKDKHWLVTEILERAK